ncbi:CHAD domain-containing protein [Streptomyces sp. NPDC008313]|uniref:CYTH and CHAD domain-containing protein n=1 Tax=Streptomyces sp. NPDC008313 TaxID=3364826 RepID=UPI0036E942E2
MADSKREIERKYEGPAGGGDVGLPDLTGVRGVARVVDRGVAELDAVYYDTSDQRLAASSVTLRRRTGGEDAGWHLKLPVAAGVRDEIRAPLSDTVPDTLRSLVRSRVRDAALAPLVRLVSVRDVRHLLDADGALLAEVSVDRVSAERLAGGEGTAEWTEVEAELADGGDPAFLDEVDRTLREAGLTPSASASKLARALGETGPRSTRKKPGHPALAGAGDHVLAYVRAQRDAIVALDPAVRREADDGVHDMRVATRRMRSAFRSYGKVLDRAVTGPVGQELKWLAGELGADRDQEVLTARLSAALDELPKALRSGPVRNRLRTWSLARRADSRRRLLDTLDSRRYLDLLAALDTLLAQPPLRAAASGKPEKVLARAVRKDVARVSDRVGHALALEPGTERDRALHEARKKAKRARYAAETATPALGGPARRLAKSLKSVQSLLGDHQDSVMAREALRELAEQADAAGESTFTYGVLYGRQERLAARAEEALPGVWEAVGNRSGL